MSKRTKKRSRRPAIGESRAVDAATIGWMLMVMTALVCELGFAVAHYFAMSEGSGWLDVLSRILLFAAAVIGFISLLAAPVVIKNRREPPPLGITLFALLVGAAPLLIIVLQIMFQ
ncbi:MAG TPA: hypothetical protein VMV69_22500 [Pirellulales bacterium]|nr:hypothetical protein [Pirellulales bacterium]